MAKKKRGFADQKVLFVIRVFFAIRKFELELDHGMPRTISAEPAHVSRGNRLRTAGSGLSPACRRLHPETAVLPRRRVRCLL